MIVNQLQYLNTLLLFMKDFITFSISSIFGQYVTKQD